MLYEWELRKWDQPFSSRRLVARHRGHSRERDSSMENAVTLKHNETIHVIHTDWPLWTARAFLSFLFLSFSLSLAGRRQWRRWKATSESTSTSAFPDDLADYDTLVNTHPRICTYLHTCTGSASDLPRAGSACERHGEEMRKYLGADRLRAETMRRRYNGRLNADPVAAWHSTLHGRTGARARRCIGKFIRQREKCFD